jgi:hypothetical protein
MEVLCVDYITTKEVLEKAADGRYKTSRAKDDENK